MLIRQNQTEDNAARVLVVAGDVLARAGLAALLETQTDHIVVGQVDGHAALADDVEVYQPDILLYDLGWSTAAMLDYLLMLADLALPVLALIGDDADAQTALGTLGNFDLFGLLLRNSDPDLLARALVTVRNGLIVIDPDLTAALIQHTTPEPLPQPLTPREDDVLQLLAQGMTNKAIAHDLGITDHTVKFHVNAIMTKLGAQSRTEAVVRATRAGLVIL